MVDRGICHCHHAIHEEYAVWHPFLSPGDIVPSSSESFALNMYPFLIPLDFRTNFPMPQKKNTPPVLEDWSIIDT